MPDGQLSIEAVGGRLQGCGPTGQAGQVRADELQQHPGVDLPAGGLPEKVRCGALDLGAEHVDPAVLGVLAGRHRPLPAARCPMRE
ncbi:hypothetical protein PV726_43635 [Streptomyces europaeiscabiei]|uniref:hypothetical protein n=1 Tax=Streptomyces europaeiscabiei TaxID=146819 RepID=UPI0029A4C99C|nr:hypothetical protein [Streptomyces europaeiscabiei]MDX3697015.1 hypothetical protein [Streptomyces europaeiscabiei]